MMISPTSKQRNLKKIPIFHFARLREIYKGRLVKLEIIDKSYLLLSIFHKYHILFENENEHSAVSCCFPAKINFVKL